MYQRSEVKCLGINSWRDDYRPEAVRGGGPVRARIRHRGRGLKNNCVFDVRRSSSRRLAFRRFDPGDQVSRHNKVCIMALCVCVCVCVSLYQ